MSEKFVFIINPNSGSKKSPKQYEQIISSVLTQKGIPFTIKHTQHQGHATQLAQEALVQNATAVIAVGGDGTINEIANALVLSACPVGIIPKGSGNGLARALKIQLDQRGALEALCSQKSIPIDLGIANDRYFANLAGIGLDAQIGHAFNARDGKPRGILPYCYLTLKHLASYKPDIVNISILKPNGRTLQKTIRPLLVAVANGTQYGAGALIAPEARLNDGAFHVTVINAMPMWKAVWALPKLFNGRIASVPHVQIYPASKVIVKSSKPFPYHLDGEPFIAQESLTLEIKKHALKVIAPELRA